MSKLTVELFFIKLQTNRPNLKSRVKKNIVLGTQVILLDIKLQLYSYLTDFVSLIQIIMNARVG